MTENCEQCKQNPVEIARNTCGTPTAKLIAILAAHGVTDTDELAAIIGIGERAIRKARNPSGNVTETHSCGTTVPEPQFRPGTTVPQRNHSSGTTVPKTEPQFRGTEVATRAPTESFQDKYYLEVKKDSPLAPQGGRTSPKRGSRLDGDWTLPDDWRMWARTNFPASTDASVTDQAAQFRDYWIAKPGAQACKLDWEATWRNWCRKGLSAAGHVRQPQHTGSWNRASNVVEYKPIPRPERREYRNDESDPLFAELMRLNGVSHG